MGGEIYILRAQFFSLLDITRAMKSSLDELELGRLKVIKNMPRSLKT